MDAPAIARCKHGHDMTGENVYVVPHGGQRRCKACMRKWNAAYRVRQKEKYGPQRRGPYEKGGGKSGKKAQYRVSFSVGPEAALLIWHMADADSMSGSGWLEGLIRVCAEERGITITDEELRSFKAARHRRGVSWEEARTLAEAAFGTRRFSG